MKMCTHIYILYKEIMMTLEIQTNARKIQGELTTDTNKQNRS